MSAAGVPAGGAGPVGAGAGAAGDFAMFATATRRGGRRRLAFVGRARGEGLRIRWCSHGEACLRALVRIRTAQAGVQAVLRMRTAGRGVGRCPGQPTSSAPLAAGWAAPVAGKIYKHHPSPAGSCTAPRRFATSSEPMNASRYAGGASGRTTSCRRPSLTTIGLPSVTHRSHGTSRRRTRGRRLEEESNGLHRSRGRRARPPPTGASSGSPPPPGSVRGAEIGRRRRGPC